MTNTMTVLEKKSMERAMATGSTVWVSPEFNRGWTFNLITDKKIRMKAEEHQAQLQLQLQIGEEILAEETIEQGKLADQEEAEEEIPFHETEEAEEMAIAENKRTADFLESWDIQQKLDFNRSLNQEVPVFEEDGKKWQIEEGVEGTVILEEVGSTKQLADHVLIEASKGKTPKMKIIECKDCKEPRIIKMQDAFQVTRCKDCQKKHRNARRRELNKQKKEQAGG